jgi:hypothetical protein
MNIYKNIAILEIIMTTITVHNIDKQESSYQTKVIVGK